MQYNVKITNYAVNQIKEIISYISIELQSPHTAVSWSVYLQKEISNLNIFPNRFPLIDIEPWKSRGIHKTYIKNFAVYYLVNEENKTVWITSVIYAKMNEIEKLKEMPL